MSETLVRDTQETIHNDPTTGEPLPPVNSAGYWDFDYGQYDAASAEQGGKERTETEVLDEFIAERAKEAMRDCEFEPTNELEESIEGFYHDHFYLAGAIKAVTEGRFDSDLFKTIASDPRIKDWEKRVGREMPHGLEDYDEPNPNAITAAYRLALMAQEISGISGVAEDETLKIKRFNALRQRGSALIDTLFHETSVGITTIGDSEVQLTKDLIDKVKEASGGGYISEKGITRQAFPTSEHVSDVVAATQKRFWDDTRHAGQLEFHGSMDIGGINVNGLMSRNQQVRKLGHMRAQTEVKMGTMRGTMHSVVPHFSEFYGGGGYAADARGGTFAIPLAKVINKAPYARDGLYGFLKPKTESVLDKIPILTLEHPTDSVGAGRADEIGMGGADRVFFASPDELSDKLPDDYVISLHDKSNIPATLIINRNLPGHDVSRELQGLGTGYGFPERLIIEKGEDASFAIRKLQEEYMREFAGYGIVVPLRRGVFAQVFEGVASNGGKGREPARVYNKYYEGSELKVA